MKELIKGDGTEYALDITTDDIKGKDGKTLTQIIDSFESKGDILPNLYEKERCDVEKKGIVYNTGGSIQAHNNYTCAFIPLAFDSYFCIANYLWRKNGGAGGADSFALAKGTKDSFTNLTSSDFVSGANWLSKDTAFAHNNNIVALDVRDKNIAFTTPKKSELKDQSQQIGLVINVGLSGLRPVEEMIVVNGITPYLGGSAEGKNFLFFGDSITLGGYPEVVNDIVKFNVFRNYGDNGNATERLYTHVKGKEFDLAHGVVIMIGTNADIEGEIDADIPDIGVYDIPSYPYQYSDDTKTVKSASINSPEEFFDKCFANTYYGNLAKIVEYIKWVNNDCRIYIVTIPVSERGNHVNIRNRIYNLNKKMCAFEVIDAQVNAGVGLFNITYWTSDTVTARTHFNAIGNKMWGSYVAKSIKSLFY